MVFSSWVVLDFENAMFAGANAAASPNIELALRNPRRDLLSGAMARPLFWLRMSEQIGRRVDHNRTDTSKQSDEGIGNTLVSIPGSSARLVQNERQTTGQSS